MNKLILKYLMMSFIFCWGTVTFAFGLEEGLVDSYTALNKLKKSLVAQEEYKKAVDFLDEFISKHPDTYFADMASIEIGDIYFKYLKDYHKALEYYIKVAHRDRNPELTKKVINKIKEVQKALSVMELNIIELALDSYFIDNLRYPDRLATLYKKSYIKKKEVLIDSWGEDYYYRTVQLDFFPNVADLKYLLFSYGPDKKRGTLDDIIVTPEDKEKNGKLRDKAAHQRYPLRLRNIVRRKGVLKGVVSSKDSGMREYLAVEQGDTVGTNLILGVRPEGIVIYTKERRAVFIPLKK